MIYINARFLTQSVTGVQRFAIEISKCLKNHLRDSVTFLSPQENLNEELADILGVIKIGNKKGHLWEQIDLPLYLRTKGNPLLVNLCNTAPLFYKNKIVTVHDVAFQVFPETYSKKFLYSYKLLIPIILRNSIEVVTVSEFSKREIQKFYSIPSEKIQVIYNAVSPKFRLSNVQIDKQQYFLAVSSLNFRKNLPYILDNFELFQKEYPNYKLYIVGDIDPVNFSSLNLDKYKLNTSIEFKGRVDDEELTNYYKNATAFLYPSLYEGFGIPPLEAQGCGCPVILSNDSCFPEIFSDSVLYCDLTSRISLYNQMKELVFNFKNVELIRKGLDNCNRYSWENSADKLTSIMNRN